MGRQRTFGLEWLEPENVEQRIWARDYLLVKGYGQHFHCRDSARQNQVPSYEEMLLLGRKIEQENGAYKLIQSMKDAWRQEKSRSKKKDRGHHVYLFTFKISTKENLQKMARELGTDATALLEKMIARAYQAHLRKHQKHSNKHSDQTLRVDQPNTSKDIQKRLISNVTHPGDSEEPKSIFPYESTDELILAKQRLRSYTLDESREKPIGLLQKPIMTTTKDTPISKQKITASLRNPHLHDKAPSTLTDDPEQESSKIVCPKPIAPPTLTQSQIFAPDIDYKNIKIEKDKKDIMCSLKELYAKKQSNKTHY